MWQLLIVRRNQIIICCFLATFTAYVERVGFSIAFTKMAEEAELDESRKGVVFSLFYWGYGVSQVRLVYYCAAALADFGSQISSGSPAASPDSICQLHHSCYHNRA